LVAIPGRVIGGEDGAELVESAAEAWEAVSTAQVEFAAGAPLPVDVEALNYLAFVARCGDGLSPVIFDPFGSIVDAAFGTGASEFVLGFTVHDCGYEPPPRMTESSVVINGAALASLEADPRPALLGVIVHEFGHVLNLCHSHLHAEFADDGIPANDAFLPVMFPFRSGDDLGADPTPRFDDRAMLSMLYPAPDFFATTGTISGHVLSGDQGRPVSGTAVVVRSTADPLGTAQWTTSGWLRLEGVADLWVPVADVIVAIDGSYQASGLPPGSYTVEVEGGISGESVEFYSGLTEGGDPAIDPPDVAMPIDVRPGSVRTDVTIELDRHVQSLFAETEWDVRWRGGVSAAGGHARLPRDALPPGQLEFLSTGTYRVTPLFALGGLWTPRGKRKFRHRIDRDAIQMLFDPTVEIARVSGHGRANRALRRIRGTIVARGRAAFPFRGRVTVRLRYRGRRNLAAREPGRLPLLPVVSVNADRS
jgi:hypothetical protein